MMLRNFEDIAVFAMPRWIKIKRFLSINFLYVKTHFSVNVIFRDKNNMLYKFSIDLKNNTMIPC